MEEHFEFWKCDSCGAEGDAVQYAMHHLRTASEDEALLDVCKKLGVVIPVLPTITAKELMEKEFPPRVELIEGMLGPGLYILAGAPKIGKSWLVLQIAHHISTGTPLWDRRVSRHAVLYLCLEDTLQRIQSRLLTICDGEGIGRVGEKRMVNKMEMATVFRVENGGHFCAYNKFDYVCILPRYNITNFILSVSGAFFLNIIMSEKSGLLYSSNIRIPIANMHSYLFGSKFGDSNVYHMLYIEKI